MSDESGLRDILNAHYWRDSKGCSCGDWSGDYNAWMVHVIPIIKSYVQGQLADALEKIAAIEHYNKALSKAHGELCELLEERNAQVDKLQSYIEQRIAQLG